MNGHIGRALGLGGLGLLTVAVGLLLATRSAELGERERDWQTLARRAATDGEAFHPEMAAGLPDPARRYVLHAIAPGTALAGRVELEMGGSMRLGPDGAWMPLRARQLLAPPHGLIWEARAGRGPMSFSGADSYVHGAGEVRFRLWGLVPFVRAGGPDVARSARGRLAAEAVWTPAALLPDRGVTWEPIDATSARYTMTIDGEPITTTIVVDRDGRLLTATLDRWGDKTDDGRYAPIPFGVRVLEEGRFGGYTIPAKIGGGWWFGTERYFEFARFEIERATFG